MKTPVARSANPVVEPCHDDQILVDALLARGVDMASGMPGENYLSMFEGSYQRRDRARFIVCRQEGGTASMVDAYGKLTGRLDIVFCTRRPGATNASIGVYTGFQNSAPLILFIGQVGHDFIDREAFQEIDYRRTFDQMAKRVAQIDSVECTPEYIVRTFQITTAGRPGPAVLALPEDMLTDVATMPDVSPEFVTETRVMAWPDPRDLVQLKTLLQDAERPMLLLSGPGWTSQAAARVQTFAERWNLPVGCVLRRQDLFDNRHPSYAGDVGIAISPGLAARVKGIDVVLAVGTRLGEMMTSDYTLFDVSRPRQTLVRMHTGAGELGYIYQADLIIHASMPMIAEALDGASSDAPSCWFAWTEAASADYRADIAPSSFGGKGISMARVVQWLCEHLPQNSILINGADNYAMWLRCFYQYGPLTAGLRTQLAPVSGAMGYSTPAMVTVKIVCPDTPVTCMAGSGYFLINGRELVTAIQYNAPIIFVVVNNGMYGTIRMYQEHKHPKRVSGTEPRSPGFIALARIYGAEGHTVHLLEGFQSAMKAALTASIATVIKV